MHIERIYIKNFKAWNDDAIHLPSVHTVFIGENDAGKSSILEALNYFFQEDAKIDKDYVINADESVEIGILLCDQDGQKSFLKKEFTGKTHKAVKVNPGDAAWAKAAALTYIYIPANYNDPEAILKQLSKAKVENDAPSQLITKLNELSQQAIDDVLAGIDSDIVVVGEDDTAITASPKVNIAKAIDYAVTNDGIPLAGRGSGYRKNLTYAMLIGSTYENVILGIDEIENSFSMMNCAGIINVLTNHVSQLLVTTHSADMLKHRGDAQPYPVGKNPGTSLAEIIKSLNGGGGVVLLVEGKYDIPWFAKAVSLLDLTGKIVILPGGGTNAPLLNEMLNKSGSCSLLVLDGDTSFKADESKGIFALARECVELYASDKALSDSFGCTPERTKEVFFGEIEQSCDMNRDKVKEVLAEKMPPQLKPDNAFVVEVGELLERFTSSNKANMK